ncbi:hypothetical protein BOX24_04605 [Leptospirillum ferriphilum]|uniref:Uncharacterized protein n=1 Tax=Leptospirillum ferriphilum TaxID=178606 RepID=A0A1V3SW95_9BACT|nr:hypothetical protein BOX24_04605 [Leptospirillum ferriphilum]
MTGPPFHQNLLSKRVLPGSGHPVTIVTQHHAFSESRISGETVQSELTSSERKKMQKSSFHKDPGIFTGPRSGLSVVQFRQHRF